MRWYEKMFRTKNFLIPQTPFFEKVKVMQQIFNILYPNDCKIRA